MKKRKKVQRLLRHSGHNQSTSYEVSEIMNNSMINLVIFMSVKEEVPQTNTHTRTRDAHTGLRGL